MEFGLREWIMVASAVLMVAVVAPGFWMRWRNRRNRLRLEIERDLIGRSDSVDELDLLRAELPNGGARVKTRAEVAASREKPPMLLNPVTGKGVGRQVPQIGDEQRNRIVDVEVDDVPLIHDDAVGSSHESGDVVPEAADVVPDSAIVVSDSAVVVPDAARAKQNVDRRWPAGDNADQLDQVDLDQRPKIRKSFRDELPPTPAAAVASAPEAVPAFLNEPVNEPLNELVTEPVRDLLGDIDPAATARSGEPATRRKRRAVMEKVAESNATSSGPTTPPGPQELIVLHVFSRELPGFSGDQLVHAVNRAGLKYGDMNIFHRMHGGMIDGGGVKSKRAVVFSVASAVEPGTFDLSTISDTKIPGLAFFLQLPGPTEPLESFEDMLAVARGVAAALDGDVKDENQSVMTPQTVEHYRERIRDFARKQQIRG